MSDLNVSEYENEIDQLAWYLSHDNKQQSEVESNYYKTSCPQRYHQQGRFENTQMLWVTTTFLFPLG